MDWTSLLEGMVLIGTLIAACIFAYGGWLCMKAQEADQHRTPGANRPKSLGWRE